MRNKLAKIALAASVLLALVFTISCSVGKDDDSNSVASSSSKASTGSSSSGFNGNSQIYKKNCSSNGVCKDTTYNDDGYIYEWYLEQKAGTVTKGNIRLQLSSITPQDHYFEPIINVDENDIKQYCPTGYTDGIVYGYLARISLRKNDSRDVGGLSIMNENFGEGVFYWYSPKDGKAKCDINGEIKLDLTITKGWNTVYTKMTIETQTVITSDGDTLTQDYRVQEYSTKKSSQKRSEVDSH